jgi:hypothetical protein
VRDWTITFNQPVEPMYLNGPELWPLYLKVGVCDATLEVGTFEKVLHQNIIIATSGVTITGYTASQGYSFNGASDVGTYRHSFSSGTPFGSAGVGIQ